MLMNYSCDMFTSKLGRMFIKAVIIGALFEYVVLLRVVDLYPRVSLPDIEFRHTIPPHLRPMISPALLSKDSAYPGDAVPDR